MSAVLVAGILEVAEVWSSGLAELGPAQPQHVFTKITSVSLLHKNYFIRNTVLELIHWSFFTRSSSLALLH